MKHKRKFSGGVKNSFNSKAQRGLVLRWALTILLELRGWKQLEKDYRGFTSDGDVLGALDLSHLEDKEICRSEFLKLLRGKRAEIADKPASPDEILDCNSKQVAEYLGLDPVERDILVFSVLLLGNKGLQETASKLGELNSEGVSYVLSTILDAPLLKIRKAISREGLLSRSGILNIDRKSTYDLHQKIELLNGFGEALQEPVDTIDTLFQRYYNKAEPSELSEKDYPHAADSFSLIINHLSATGHAQKNGVNILIYGPPGTGKTELAKVIAESIGHDLYSVSLGDDDSPFNKPERIRAYQLAQKVLSRRKNSLVLFDEIDAVLAESFSFFFLDGNSLNLKALINHNLENGSVPAIWIANNIGYADSAFIRRFDVVLHLDHPPRSVRKRILDNVLDGISVREGWKERLAENRMLSPAVVTRAVKVIRNQMIIDEEETESRLESLLESTLTAMGHPRKPVVKHRNDISYRLDAVNADCNLSRVIKGLRENIEGRLCLYGPPGTGKTEFGHHLAREIDKPLLLKRSSDLLGPYVGETEANIASMFQEADYEDAVLLLDEADSFLRDRKDARHRWEVTQVNELLTQMENYHGVFICSTNLMAQLDEASLRRFDLKVKFDFLLTGQVWLMFSSILSDYGTAEPEIVNWKNSLNSLSLLTPGDFATVLRKARLKDEKLTPRVLFEGLQQEVEYKQGTVASRIGFLTPDRVA